MCIYIYIRTFGFCPSKVPFVLNHELIDPWAAILAFGDEVAIADLQISMKVSRLQVKRFTRGKPTNRISIRKRI